MRALALLAIAAVPLTVILGGAARRRRRINSRGNAGRITVVEVEVLERDDALHDIVLLLLLRRLSEAGMQTELTR